MLASPHCRTWTHQPYIFLSQFGMLAHYFPYASSSSYRYSHGARFLVPQHLTRSNLKSKACIAHTSSEWELLLHNLTCFSSVRRFGQLLGVPFFSFRLIKIRDLNPGWNEAEPASHCGSWRWLLSQLPWDWRLGKRRLGRNQSVCLQMAFFALLLSSTFGDRHYI